MDRIFNLEKNEKIFKNSLQLIQTEIDQVNKQMKKKSESEIEPESNENFQIPVLIIACNRPTVSRALDSILAARSKFKEEQFPILVSQDCGHEPTLAVIKEYADKYKSISYIEQKDRSEPWLNVKKNMLGYFKLSRHYKFAINEAFSLFQSSNGIIIVEDDLEVSPDFLNYFKTFSPLLFDKKENLYCISAWNDNGKDGQIENNSKLIYRTDFFGGLGWMLSRQIWENEWSDSWPDAFWDDWVRGLDQRKERSCIRPEVSRTSTFGKVGVSMGQFFDKHLAHIHRNTQETSFTLADVTDLKQQNYDFRFLNELKDLPTISANNIKAELDQFRSRKIPFGKVKVIYDGKKDFIKIAKTLSIMEDFKAGVPRGGYKGVVTTVRDGIRIYISPPNPETWKYHPEW